MSDIKRDFRSNSRIGTPRMSVSAILPQLVYCRLMRGHFIFSSYFAKSAARSVVLALALTVIAVTLVALLLPGAAVPLPFTLLLVCAAALAASVGTAIVLQHRVHDLGEENALLSHDARHDDLTELPNRREFFERIADHFQAGTPTALLLIDADKFKRVNDVHGHHTGDEALKMLARIFIGNSPEDALVARLGGEEFGVILPDTGSEAARLVAERLCLAVESSGFISPEGAACPLTISIGVDRLREGQNEFPLREADMALWAAKAAGRNRVATYSAILHPSKGPSQIGASSSAS